MSLTERHQDYSQHVQRHCLRHSSYFMVSSFVLSALMCIVRPDGPPQLCKTDEIGEIIINSRAGGTMYYGLPGLTKNTFEVCVRGEMIQQPAVCVLSGKKRGAVLCDFLSVICSGDTG